MDGGIDMQPGSAMVGGIVRCHHGDWVFGYGCNIGISSILEAELWIIVDGLETAWGKGVHWLLIKSDSKTTIDRLGAEVVGSSRLTLEVRNWITKG